MIVVLGGVLSSRLSVQAEVLVLLVDTVELRLELFDTPPLRLQELGLVLNDVIELQEVLHSPAGAVWVRLHGPGFGARAFGVVFSPPPTELVKWGGNN